MTIREATADDTPRLVEMAQRFLRESAYGDLLPASDDALAALVDKVLAMGVIFVVDVQAAAVGMIALVELEHEYGGVRFADEIVWWIEPEYRTGTLGPRLLRRAEAWARDRGLVLLKMVAPAGTDVGAFYERLGYQPVETSYAKALT